MLRWLVRASVAGSANSDVKSETGLRLATLQASKQFELYTGLKFPLGD